MTVTKTPPNQENEAAASEIRYRRFFTFLSAVSTALIIVFVICYLFYWLFRPA
ncbi:hypothetical protein [Paenibacillus spongiae]|uniref:Cytochrome c oxidase subunit 2A n=1 Tax=Paenibacillus spongiae TaxID=2909671 RepID=A0ABY5S4D1_9BACL|nr:hypothetical protein [Paenibacillus spongiae]UVI28746.1 hypothetical protein L1F29_25390 [Paenibacillus spongiae]